MLNLDRFLNKIFSGDHLKHFHGGVHPEENKLQSTRQPIKRLPIPPRLILPLRQHVGNVPKLRVEVGQSVLKGQLLAEPEGQISAAVHAPTSGIVTAIAPALIPHPSGLPDMCLTLDTDGQDTWQAQSPLIWQDMDRLSLVAGLRSSGIVGLGGAAFPSHIKLRPDGRSEVHTLIVNAAECEPYITCDDMLMREQAQQIVRGIEVAQHILGAHQCLIGIEENKPEAAEAMRAAIAGAACDIRIVTVPTLYPSGDARRLIYLLTGTEVPSDKRSTQVGIQCFNVATLMAMYRYVAYGEPSVSRIVTVTGHVATPGNYEVLFGTPVSTLLAAAGGVDAASNTLIMGGPMMGFSLPSDEVPVTKACNCIIASTPELFPEPPPAMPCIRCARCAEACPVQLQPQELYWFAKSDNFDKARDYKLFDCIECGCCTYVCPSHIPLVQYYRYAKSEIISQDRAKEAADIARERNEFRLMRIEREKQERTQRHAQKAGGANKADDPATGALDEQKKAALAAAMARAQAQKTAGMVRNTGDENPTVQAEIAAIESRRAAIASEVAGVPEASTASPPPEQTP